ncbi:urease accessory protein UreD [Actinoplanes sp. NPDC024001]|uniref:urease accessory protein UreD n=1 Tax=Actinoplanes sp. NPDC024001 TaxID=3154598 RepID=UPI00340EC2E7
MRARAHIVAEADGRGGTRLAVLHGESPLLLRRTGPVRDTGVTVHLVGGAAGPLRGDELRLDIEVGPGARLEMLSVAASLALPGRPAPASRLTVTASVAAGGTLRWLPEPLIAASGCDHVAVTRVAVEAGGSLLWRDDLVCGRHGEEPGDVRADTLIRYAGTTLYRHELAVGPRAPGWDGAAVLGGARAIGTLVAAGPDHPSSVRTSGPLSAPRSHATAAPSSVPTSGAHGGLSSHATAAPPSVPTSGAHSGPSSHATAAPPSVPTSGAHSAPSSHATAAAGGRAAVMPLAGPGWLATAVGDDIREVRAALDPLCRRPLSPVPA